ncbi:hypothetical protein [Thalassotalea montiporae]
MSIENTEVNLEIFGTAGLIDLPETQSEGLRISSFPKDVFTVCDDESLVFTTHTVADKDGNQYIVAKDIADKLSGDAKARQLYLAMMRTGETFVLSVPAPTPANRKNSWVRSAHDAVQKGMKNYIRVSRFDEAYRTIESQKPFKQPEWPDISLEEMIEQAFDDRFITDSEHPVMKELIGF